VSETFLAPQPLGTAPTQSQNQSQIQSAGMSKE